MTRYLREVEKTWRAHQTLLQPSKLSPFWKRRSSWCSWQAQSFHAHLGHCASATLKNSSTSGRSFGEAPNKIVFPPGHPNYTSVVLLLTSWIKERCLSCCSSLTDPQGQPKSTSWLAGPTSISSWLHDFLLQTEMVFLHSFFLTFYQQLSQSSVAYNITSGKNKNCFVQLKQYFCKLFINMSFSLSDCK